MEPSDLALLATLDALLQEGSVSGAARKVGLSTPAMSHGLSRIRAKIGDPILVRSGRGMLLTPRAEALKPRVHAIVVEARKALEPSRPFVASELTRPFTVLASDYVLCVLGVALDRILRAEAPRAVVRFLPNTANDGEALRDGGADLAVGIYGSLPQETRTRQLLTDRFVVAARADHPEVGKRLSLEQFTRIPHIQVAPRGLPGGYVDDVLRKKKLSRHVARGVPYFLPALYLTAQSDYLLTVSERVFEELGASLGLRAHPVPIKLQPYALSLVWHPRFDGDRAHEFVRSVFLRAANESAGNVHASARTRLDDGRKRRPRRSSTP